MKKERINSFTVEYYDGDITELPVVRYQAFQKFLLIDAGIGSSLEDISRHIDRMRIYITEDKKDKALVELANTKQNLHFISRGITPRHLAFCALVYSVNGQPCTDLSDEGLSALHGRLSVVSASWIDRLISAVKKKSDAEKDLYFPGKFDSAKSKEFYVKLKKQVNAICENIIKGGKDDEVEQLERELTVFSDPLSFAGQESAEVKFTKAFEDACYYLTQGGHHPKLMTVYEFYNGLLRHGRQSNQNKRPVRR